MNMNAEVMAALGKRRRVLNLHTVIGLRGGVTIVTRELYVSQATLYRWLKDGTLPRERAADIADQWGIPVLMLHDPWAGGAHAAEVLSPDETRAFLDGKDSVQSGGARRQTLAKGEKPKPPPMIRADGQPQPGWRFTYRPKKVNEYNTVVTVKVARGARWIEGFPAEGSAGFPVRFTWLDGREIGLADNGSGTLVYVEVDTGHPFGDSKPAIRTAHAAIRAMATRGVHDRVEAKWEGDESDMEGVDGED